MTTRTPRTRTLALGAIALLLTTGGLGAWTLAQPGERPGRTGHRDDDDRAGGHDRDDADEESEHEDEVIRFDQAPDAVRAAALKIAGNAAAITRVIRTEWEGDDDDGDEEAQHDEAHIVAFEIEYRDAQTPCSMILTSGGHVLETERATTMNALPPAAMGALREAFPGASFDDLNTLTLTLYEVDVIRDGRKREARVDAVGRLRVGDNEDDDEREGDRERDDDD